MKVAVFGRDGQLGLSLVGTAPENCDLVATSRIDLDVTDESQVFDYCADSRPDVIVNAAAYTAVDRAEAEPEIAASVNIDGPRIIASAARAVGARVIHISTDYVFDGESSIPYRPDAAMKPLNVYGQTKRDGEVAMLEEAGGSAVVIRTSWLYSRYGRNFVKTMLTMMRERDELRVVADQFGTPTWADSLAKVVWRFVDAPDLSGTFHWTDGDDTTWHGFAVAIQEEACSLGLLSTRIPIHAITTAEYPTAAKRPLYSVLDCSSTEAALNSRQTHWRDNLRQMLMGMLD